MDILTTVIIVAVIGIIASVVLVVAAKVMYVYEDERIGKVAACLPGANCGGCGYAGCSDYAKAIVEKGAELTKCAPGGADTVAAIGKVMGVSASAGAAKKAVVKCQGHSCNTGNKFDYQGVTTCSAASKMFGGPGDCAYGCLGFGDCVNVCPFGAIQVVDGVARVINEKCTGCGACAKVCPKFVIELVEDDVKPMVLCNNKDKGGDTRKACNVGCIGCKRCEKVCPIYTAKDKAVHVDGFLAHIDQDLCIGCMQCAEECPVGAIDIPNCR